MTVSVTVVVVLSLSLVGPASGSSTLRSKLLQPTQLPNGWTMASPSGALSVPCVGSLLAGAASSASEAQATFEDEAGLPAVTERLRISSHPSLDYQRLVATLKSCPRIRGSVDGVALSGTVRPLSFVRVATASAAFRAVVNVPGLELDVDVDVIIARKGDCVIWLGEVNAPPLNESQFRGLVHLAVNRA